MSTIFIRALAALVGAAGCMSGAAAAAAATDMALVERGDKIAHTVAGIGCVGCHGRFGEGDTGVGPYIRGVGLSKVQAAIAAVSAMQMVKTQLSPQDVEAVAAYWHWTGRHQVVKTLLKRDRFIPDVVDVYPGTSLQIVVNNSGQAPRKLLGPGTAAAEFTVAGREFHDFIWRAPEQEGSYTLRCADCSVPDQSLTVRVSRSARQYHLPDSDQ